MTGPITVLIADDEHLARKGIRHILAKEPDFEVVAEATNGLEAVERVGQCHPQIVLMDVQMPVLDGLEALKQIRECNLPVAPVILSGYNQFSYAQKALKLGVYEYVLKPVDPAELLHVLTRLKEFILGREQEKNLENKLKMQLSYGMPAFMETFYTRLLEAKYLPVELDEIIQRLEIQNGTASVLHISPDDGYQLKTLYGKERYWEFTNHIRSSLHAFLEREATKTIPLLQVEKGDFVIILPDAVSESVTSFASRLKSWLGEGTGVSFSIAVGPQRPLIDLHESYQTALKRLKQRLMIGRDAVIDYDAIRPGSAAIYLADLEKKMENAIRLGDRALAQRFLEVLLNRVASLDFFSPDNWSHLCFDLLEMGYRIAKEFGIVRLIPVAEEAGEISGLTTEADIRAWLNHYLDEIIPKIKECIGGPPLEVKKALSYMEEHLATPLTLASVSAYVGFSPNYLSQMVKRSTGKTFVEHLTGYRMEAAKRLLKQGGHNISEISSRVGYENQRYFTQVFMKQEGITPSEYRKSAY